jgi:protease I
MATNGSSHGTIACLLASEFEDSELRIPLDRLEEAGYHVEIIGFEAGAELIGEKGLETVLTDRSIDDADAASYEGLLNPGGYSPDKLRADDRFVNFVKDFDVTGRPLAAVCHGPQLLLAAELQRGRTLTAWPTVQGDLRQAGAEVKDEAVVVDDNWITSRKPDDLHAFTSRFIQRLGELEEHGAWWHGHASATTESYPHG